jgi:predicted membrane chloride channel (bestrophin family)
MGRKSRHYRDESDTLLGIYSDQIAASSSARSYGNPVHVPSSNNGCGNPLPSLDIRKLSPIKLFGHRRQESGAHSITDSLSGSRFTDNDVLTNSMRMSATTGEQEFKEQQQQQQQQSPSSNGRKKKDKDRYKIHRVSYTAQNHVQVLFQMYGSAFPQVFPFCLSNCLWTLFVAALKEKEIVDLTFHSSIGHSFMGLLVSFLIVSRSKISYDRFMEYRRHLATAYRMCREIAQFTTVYTGHTQTPQAKEWRSEVCYRTIVLLRVTMDCLLWSSTEREKWGEEYYKYKPTQDKNRDDVSEHFFRFRSLSHGRRSNIDENFRAPISFSHVLRQVIMQHPEYLGYKMPVNEYRDLIIFVSKYLESFHGFRVLIFTPYPFPLVQMTRAFLFFWVYSLPLVLLNEYRLENSLLIVTLVTFGFIGVEYVSMALDDPFGDDTNDVDEHGMALLVYEDIYLTIYRTDGPEAAMELRERVLARYKQGRGLDCYRDDLKGYDFWEPRGKPAPGQHDETDEEGEQSDYSANV